MRLAPDSPFLSKNSGGGTSISSVSSTRQSAPRSTQPRAAREGEASEDVGISGAVHSGPRNSHSILRTSSQSGTDKLVGNAVEPSTVAARGVGSFTSTRQSNAATDVTSAMMKAGLRNNQSVAQDCFAQNNSSNNNTLLQLKMELESLNASLESSLLTESKRYILILHCFYICNTC